ncbi:MAG TPA: ABC transporter permease subunit, partial [Patescibacteria group bacterium]|nr:ABC transporter permease subunit [Patescibacteria group bacterium]
MASQAIDHPKSVILAFVFRRSLIGALLWGAIFGFIVATSAFGFEAAFNTPASKAQAAALGANAGLQALLGPPHSIETVAGFTAWRSVGIVILFGAVWSILLATKNFRGEEEAGRWELLLSGQTTTRRAVFQTFLGLGFSLGAMFLVVAGISVIVGQSLNTKFNVPDAIFLALSSVCAAGIFLAIGALISQVVATRRQATTWTAAIFGICFVLRAVSGASSNMGWLGWFSPIKWIDELQPLTNPSPEWLVPIGALIVGLVLLTVYLANQRDLGSSLLHDHESSRPHTTLLRNAFTTSLLLLKGNIIGWLIGVSLFSYLFGTVSL